MGYYLIQIKDKFLEWSTVVDAPITYGMSLKQLKSYIKNRYGSDGLRDLSQRLERIKKTGCSCQLGMSVDELIENNRAGENEECLSKKQIYKQYCSENSS